MNNNFYDLNIEKIILGTIVIDCSILPYVKENISVNDFYGKENQEIFRSMLNITKDKNITLTIDLLKSELKSRNILENLVDEIYLDNIFDIAVTSAEIDVYLEILKKYTKIRKLREINKKLSTNLLENDIDPDNIYEELQVKMSNYSDNGTKSSIVKISDIINEMKLNLDNGNLIGEFIKTGYSQFDDITNGLRPGSLVVLAARPGIGKTAFSLNLALNVAEQGKKVLIFNLEMNKNELVNRLLSTTANIDLKRIFDNSVVKNDEELVKLNNAYQILSNYDIEIEDNANVNIEYIKNSCRNSNRESKVDLIIVDYLQLINHTIKNSTREQVVSEVSRNLKTLALELNVPIIALSQLSRKVETRGDRPMLSDLRESGAIEQDADQVLFLHTKSGEKDRAEKDKTMMSVELLLMKNRNGRTGNTLLFFKGQWQKFVNPTKEEISRYFSYNDDNN